jgi:hypothetical protein
VPLIFPAATYLLLQTIIGSSPRRSTFESSSLSSTLKSKKHFRSLFDANVEGTCSYSLCFRVPIALHGSSCTRKSAGNTFVSPLNTLSIIAKNWFTLQQRCTSNIESCSRSLKFASREKRHHFRVHHDDARIAEPVRSAFAHAV